MVFLRWISDGWLLVCMVVSYFAVMASAFVGWACVGFDFQAHLPQATLALAWIFFVVFLVFLCEVMLRDWSW